MVVALVALTTSGWLPRALMLAAVGAAWFATDRVLRTTHALAVRSREQRELFDHMLRSIDDERAALAHRLHDGPQQTMTAVRLMGGVIADAVRSGDDDRATEVLRRLEQLASDAADDLRRTVAGLHPVVMEQRGLVQALGSLAETVHEEYGVDARFTKPSSRMERRRRPRHRHLPDRPRGGDQRRQARPAAGHDPARAGGWPPAPDRRRLRRDAHDHERGRHRPAHDAGARGPDRRGHHLDARPGRWSTVRLEMPAVTGPPAR